MTKIEKNMAMASAKSLRVSPIKANLVLKMIRGKKAENAVNILTFSRRRISLEVLKILKSAIANAEHNNSADIDDLKIKTIYVDKGATLKRIRARAKGRAAKIQKQTSHITLTVGS